MNFQKHDPEDCIENLQSEIITQREEIYNIKK